MKLWLLVLTGALIASPALGQNMPAKGIKTVQDAIQALASRPASTANEEAALRAMYRFSRCVVSSPGEASRLLATMPASEQERKLENSIAVKRAGCLNAGGADLRFNTAYLRGGVAEGFFKRDFGIINAPAKRRPVATFIAPQETRRAALPGEQLAALELLAFADCVVERAPENVSSLFAAELLTQEEQKAWASLNPVFAGCVKSTQRLQIKKLQLRGTLAEAAYRRMAAKIGPPS